MRTPLKLLTMLLAVLLWKVLAWISTMASSAKIAPP
jgi:hypothetical protein